MIRRLFALTLLCTAAALAQVPNGVILVKGATPDASDTTTPLPEQGALEKGTYHNRYFGLSFRLPAGYDEPYSGPPPSDTGVYVLGQYVPSETAESKATLLLTASDLFFTLLPAPNAIELAKYTSSHLPSYYTLERAPSETTIAGHKFVRFDYVAPGAGLHWAVLTTEARCHALQLVITSQDPKLIERIASSFRTMQFDSAADAPLCVPNYATDATIVEKVAATPADHRFNRIPIRLVIDKEGKVKHIHFLSVFPDQARTLSAALKQWRFKPYVVDGQAVEIETGLDLGAH